MYLICYNIDHLKRWRKVYKETLGYTLKGNSGDINLNPVLEFPTA